MFSQGVHVYRVMRCFFDNVGLPLVSRPCPYTPLFRSGGYGLLGLRASWAVNREIVLNMKVDNLLDKAYSRALYQYQGQQYGYREAGRALMVGMTWTPDL